MIPNEVDPLLSRDDAPVNIRFPETFGEPSVGVVSAAFVAVIAAPVIVPLVMVGAVIVGEVRLLFINVAAVASPTSLSLATAVGKVIKAVVPTLE